jgi:hypothetical protein
MKMATRLLIGVVVCYLLLLAMQGLATTLGLDVSASYFAPIFLLGMLYVWIPVAPVVNLVMNLIYGENA